MCGVMHTSRTHYARCARRLELKDGRVRCPLTAEVYANGAYSAGARGPLPDTLYDKSREILKEQASKESVYMHAKANFCLDMVTMRSLYRYGIYTKAMESRDVLKLALREALMQAGVAVAEPTASQPLHDLSQLFLKDEGSIRDNRYFPRTDRYDLLYLDMLTCYAGVLS